MMVSSRQFSARRETVLCRGLHWLAAYSWNCPASVRGDVLQNAGIDVVDASRTALAKTCRIICNCGWSSRCTGVPTLNEKASSLFGKAAIGLEYLLKRSGPMAMAPSQLGIFTRSGPDKGDAGPCNITSSQCRSKSLARPVHPFPAITASVCNLRPESRGSVHVAHPILPCNPTIAPHYLTTQATAKWRSNPSG